MTLAGLLLLEFLTTFILSDLEFSDIQVRERTEPPAQQLTSAATFAKFAATSQSCNVVQLPAGLALPPRRRAQLLGVEDHGLGPGPVQHRGPQPGHHQDHPVLLAVPVHGGGLPDRHVRLQAPTPLPRPPAPGHGALLPQAVRQEPRQQRVRGLPQATDRDGLDEEISEAGQEPCPHFDQAWFYLLCELMMTPQAPFFKRSVSALILNKPSS